MNDKKCTKKDKHTTNKTTEEERRHQEALEEVIKWKTKLQLSPGQGASMAMSKILWRDRSEGAVKPFAEELKKQRELLQEGDLSGIENILLDQVHVLNCMFNRYVTSGAEAERFNSFNEFYGIALKAQNQCRRTITTLVDLRNPKRATFIKQQNVGINQQVNNGEAPVVIPKKKEIPANELLEVNHDARLDTRAPQEAIGNDQTMEAVGKVDRTED